MTEVIGVRFHRASNIVYVDPKGFRVSREDGVIVHVDRGLEYGIVRVENTEMPDELLVQELLSLERVATEEDLAHVDEGHRLAAEALEICALKVGEHQLDMKLVDAEYSFDRDKLIFYFTADDRVDFRQLVRDLAQTFHTRIELRQIGVRDQARLIGGLGPCGQPLCCRRYMNDFVPVSIKMAKTQGLSLNPTKISGACGRLMCCLNYEQDQYLENTKQVPVKGTLVLTEDGQGYVVDRDVLQTRVRVHVYKADHSEDERYYSVEDIEVLQRRKKGQSRPVLLTQEELESHEFVSEGNKRDESPLSEQECCAACPSSRVETFDSGTAVSSIRSFAEEREEPLSVSAMLSSQGKKENLIKHETNDPELYAHKGRVTGVRRPMRRRRSPRRG